MDKHLVTPRILQWESKPTGESLISQAFQCFPWVASMGPFKSTTINIHTFALMIPASLTISRDLQSMYFTAAVSLVSTFGSVDGVYPEVWSQSVLLCFPKRTGSCKSGGWKQFSRLSQLCPKETPGAAALCVSFGCNTLVVFVCASVSE